MSERKGRGKQDATKNRILILLDEKVRVSWKEMIEYLQISEPGLLKTLKPLLEAKLVLKRIDSSTNKIFYIKNPDKITNNDIQQKTKEISNNHDDIKVLKNILEENIGIKKTYTLSDIEKFNECVDKNKKKLKGKQSLSIVNTEYQHFAHGKNYAELIKFENILSFMTIPFFDISRIEVEMNRPIKTVEKK